MRMTAMKKRNKKREQGGKIPAAPLLAAVLVLSGCSAGGDSPALESSFEEPERTAETLLEISDPAEKAAVEAAKARVAAMDGEPRIIATSPSTAEICDRLDLDLVGICSSTLSDLPEQYQDLPQVGTAMAPDMEIVASLNPDWILSPLQPSVGSSAKIRGH